MLKHKSQVLLWCLIFIANSALSSFYDVEVVSDPKVIKLNSNASYVDSDGVAHIFYGGNKLYHAYKNNISDDWVVEVVDDDGTVGRDATIAIDASENVHILYRGR